MQWAVRSCWHASARPAQPFHLRQMGAALQGATGLLVELPGRRLASWVGRGLLVSESLPDGVVIRTTDQRLRGLWDAIEGRAPVLPAAATLGLELIDGNGTVIATATARVIALSSARAAA
jgi:hypothetical protein